MAKHRAQAQFERAKWRKTLLFAAWTVQLVIMIVLLALFGWRLSSSLTTPGSDATVSIVWESTNIALPVFALALTSYECWRYYSETLTPWTMLFTNTLKVTCSIGALVLDVYVYVVQKPGYYYAVAGLALDASFILCTLLPAVYAIRTYHRSASLDDYRITVNAKPFGFNSSATDLERQEKAYAQSLFAKARNSSGTDTSTTDISPPSTPPRKSISHFISPAPRRSSAASSLRSVSSSSGISDVSDAPTSPATSVGSPAAKAAGLPYSHERDTQFDAYMAQQHQRRQREKAETLAIFRGPQSPTAPRKSLDRGRGRSASMEDGGVGWNTVPRFVVSAPEVVVRRASAGATTVLGVVPEEEVDMVQEEEEQARSNVKGVGKDGGQRMGLLSGKSGKLEVKKMHRPLVEQSQELLSEVDLDADETESHVRV
ncbi:hypothetical protein TD95_004748 [Thielaviopsis punctulata]|uniref:Uncharacterized protein n=1 Tax=Thielaviopsis punctulata TaxID=72032 RepID=A0A0F4ZDD2_9PEZI|nr:hypothetical protein TD95_004748 [Thielaviopsis punctulata]